jgi:hypothetical protein
VSDTGSPEPVVYLHKALYSLFPDPPKKIKIYTTKGNDRDNKPKFKT